MGTRTPHGERVKVLHFGTTRVLRWGNGLGIRIPLSLTRKVGLREGSVVELLSEGGHIVIEPLPAAPTLDHLLAGVTPENLPDRGWWRTTGGEEAAP